MTFLARRVSNDQIRTILDDPDSIADIVHGSPPELDLDKSWHAIHFLLTGSEWEIGAGAGAAILGGEPVGGDLGHGPGRLLLAEEVKSVVTGLEVVDVEELRRRFDVDALEMIYPHVWDESDFDLYIGPNYLALRDLYRRAAAADQAVVLAIS